MKKTVLLLVFVAVGNLGCARLLATALDRVGKAIGEKVGDEVGEQVGTAAAGAVGGTLHGLSPALMQLYVQGLWSAVFYHGGYWWEDQKYEPGQWSRWKGIGMKEGSEFSMAFLKRTDEGHEWWQIVAKRERDGKVEEVIIESLFEESNEAGLTKMLRLRRQFPDDAEAVEVPVTEQNRGSWYRRPVRLTKESLEGATVGNESVTTPAGTFDCKHIRYADMASGGTLDWWSSPGVPGSLVKVTRHYTRKNADGETKTATSELVEYGNDAQTRLASF